MRIFYISVNILTHIQTDKEKQNIQIIGKWNNMTEDMVNGDIIQISKLYDSKERSRDGDPWVQNVSYSTNRHFPMMKRTFTVSEPPPTLKIGNYNNLLTYSTDKHDQIYIHKLQKSVCWLYRQSSLNTAAVFLERASSRGNKQNNFSHRLPFHKSWSMPSSNFWTPYYLRIPK